MGGFTKIPKLSVGDLGEEGEGDRIALFDEAGDLVGYMMATSVGGDFVPLSGNEEGKPITGDIEVAGTGNSFPDVPLINKIFTKNEYEQGGVLFENDGASAIPYLYHKTEDGGLGIYDYLKVGTNNVEIHSDYPAYKGLVGTSFFNKLNDPNAFAQLGDLQDGYVPLSGTEVDKPITGVLSFKNDEDSGFYEMKVSSGKLVINKTTDDGTSDSGMSFTSDYDDFEDIISITNKGITSGKFCIKNNEPFSFAQLGDIATTNATGTPLSLSDLNTNYPTQGTGFKVICHAIGITYMKSSLTTWEEIRTLTVV